MILLGILLIILGVVFGIGILQTLGVLLLVLGLVLLVLGTAAPWGNRWY